MKTINTLIAFILCCMLTPQVLANDEAILVVHADTITDPVQVTPTPVPTAIPTPAPTPTPEAQIVKINGDAFFVTPIVLDLVNEQGKKFDEVGVYLTNPASSVTIRKEDNTNIILFPESLFSNSPDKEENGKNVSTSHLINGKVYISVIAKCEGQYRLETPLATIIVPLSCRRDGRSDFQTEYTQDDLNGQLKVTAVKGNIQIIDRNGVTVNLEAGQDHTIGDLVQRVTWVLPVDGDHIYGGKVNTLAWSEYDDAIGYVVEYNAPSPIFSEENASSNEFPTLLIVFPAGTKDANGNDYPFTYIEPVEDVITMEVLLPDVHEGTIEARVFPIDANGNFLSGSESSDRITITWK